jgi:hypothetical protein
MYQDFKDLLSAFHAHSVKYPIIGDAPLADPDPRSESSRPLPASVENGEQLQSVVPDAVRYDVRSAGNHEFPGSRQAARTSHLRLRKEDFDGVQNPLGDARRVPIRVASNILSDRDQVTDGPRGPNGIHRGAFFSPAVPQDFSQFATFS